MLEYDRIDISEGIDLNKSNDKSKECDICHYWFFLDKHFSYQPRLCNRCHDLMQKAMSFNDENYENNKELLRERAKNKYRE